MLPPKGSMSIPASITPHFWRASNHTSLLLPRTRLILTPLYNISKAIHTTSPLRMASWNEQLQLSNLFDVKGKVALVTGRGESVAGPSS